MIAYIHGVVVEKSGSTVIVDVHDVGYEIQVPASDFDAAAVAELVTFHTYHHIREQSQDLYGFSSRAAKKIFELLITVQGVGPKAALSILSLGESEAVRNAIASSDSAYISKASGVGKKIAERVVVDLADKVGLAVTVAHATGTAQPSVGDDAVEALIALGYNLQDALTALETVPKELSTAERVTRALRSA